MGEFKTPLLQEVSHERLDFVTEQFLRGAGDDEIIRIADQVDLVLLPLPARTAEAFVQQLFQSVQGPVRQRGGDDTALRAPSRGGEEGERDPAARAACLATTPTATPRSTRGDGRARRWRPSRRP